MADEPVSIDYAGHAAVNDKPETEQMSELDSPATDHGFALPQQRLLLELLNMSGEIAVMGAQDDTLLWTTLRECESQGWVSLVKLSDTATTIRLAKAGRDLLSN
ncbi:MAG: hypothetical protein HN527_03430 [Rhodospirillaceae bacterium]|nr:hypothetical protein [Rhodospirillaceae bacterium]